MPKPTQAQRFWAKATVRKPDTCWLWTAGTDNHGYGLFWADGQIVKAHRFAYETLGEPIPDSGLLDHICRERLCVNPNHLRLVTVAQNNQNKAVARNSVTGVRGVSFAAGRYRVRVQVNGTKYHGGRFATLAEANRAAIALRDRLMTHNDSDHR